MSVSVYMIFEQCITVNYVGLLFEVVTILEFFKLQKLLATKTKSTM